MANDLSNNLTKSGKKVDTGSEKTEAQRKAAEVLGVSQSQVQRDLTHDGSESEPERVNGPAAPKAVKIRNRAKLHSFPWRKSVLKGGWSNLSILSDRGGHRFEFSRRRENLSRGTRACDGPNLSPLQEHLAEPFARQRAPVGPVPMPYLMGDFGGRASC